MDLSTSDASAPTAPARCPPRPWLAALLSLFSPGLGHVYLWSLRAALGFAALFAVVGAAALWSVVEMPGVVLPVAALVGMLAVDVLIAFRAWRAARVRPAPRRPPRALLALALIGWLALLAVPQELLQRWVKRNLFEAFSAFRAGRWSPRFSSATSCSRRFATASRWSATRCTPSAAMARSC